MRGSPSHKLITGFAVCFLFLAFLIASFLAQDPQPSLPPSPQGSPEPSPSASATPTPPPRLPTPTPYPGAQNAHQWGSVTVFNGLPSDSVRAIAQTPDGVMWFGTDNGLARFDGRRIQTFSPGQAEGSESILALAVNGSGDLWIGTRDGAFVRSGNDFFSVQGTRGLAITAILSRGDDIHRPDTELDLVLGTDRGLVLVARKDERGSFKTAPLFDDPILSSDGKPVPITGLIQTDHGGILASTSGGGVYFVDDGIAKREATLRFGSAFVNAIVRDSNFMVWLGTDALRGASGLVTFDPDATPMRISAPTSKVLSLEGNDSGVWAGSERFGLFRFSGAKLKKNYTFENTSGGLRSNTVYTLFTDREGVLWIGTNRGVSRFDRMGPNQETVSDSPNGNFIRKLSMGDKLDGSREDQVYAGSNRGLFIQDDDEWSEIPGLRNKVIYDLKFRGGSSVFVGTSTGLHDISGRKLADGDVRGFATYNSADYAAFFGRGVIDVTTGTPRQTIFSDPTVTSIYPAFGKLWIGTVKNGLFSFDGDSIKVEVGPDVLKSGTIWKMAHFSEDDGALYIAGQHGVFAVRNGEVEQIIAVEDVRDVLPMNDEIWAATTTRGLLHARHDDRFGWLVSSIGFEQGLPSEKAFSMLPIPEGLLIATNRGVVTYRPGTIAPKIIPVRVLSQRVHDLSETAATINLEYPQNSLLIEVAGQSSRTFPEEFQYAYVLTDAKGRVIDSRVSNDAQYSPQNLPAGEYTITATAFDRDLNSSEPLTIKFSVATAPFPWTATALGVLLAISLFGLAWAMIEHRRIRLRTNELAAARFDLANEAERERRRIARDLHDQTLADLRNLIINSDKLAGNGSFRSEIESVSTEIRRICEDLSPSVLENVGLVAALEFLLSRTVEKGSFNSDDSAEEAITFPLNVQLQIYRIAQEVLTNISKHSDADRVEMSVNVNGPDGFLLKIRDNGKLFQPTAANGDGRGVANIRSRASLIGAKVKWKPDKEGWNVFSLKLEGSKAVESAV